jgi:DNA-binding response OmpR family regulator
MDKNSKLVLSVEDDPDTQEMLGVLIEQRGYGFRAVDNCADALREIRENDPVVVLMDNLLPDGNGIDLCRRVRQFNKKVPIIFLSGAGFGDEKEEALESGANVFLTKPFTLDKFYDTLMRFAPVAK